MAEEYRSPISGLTNKEAQELHRGFMTTMVIYFIIAIVAHYLMWAWRPWFPGTPGYKASVDYVARLMREAGYRVTIQQYLYRKVEIGAQAQFAAADKSYVINQDWFVARHFLLIRTTYLLS